MPITAANPVISEVQSRIRRLEGGAALVHGAAAALFVAGIVARTKGDILWCLTRPDLFAPALAQAGPHHDRVIYVEAEREEDVLTNFEEGLRFGGLGAVVAELVRLPMTASRACNWRPRLHERSGLRFDDGGARRRPPISGSRRPPRHGGASAFFLVFTFRAAIPDA